VYRGNITDSLTDFVVEVMNDNVQGVMRDYASNQDLVTMDEVHARFSFEELDEEQMTVLCAIITDVVRDVLLRMVRSTEMPPPQV
jgi:hypothetical protein